MWLAQFCVWSVFCLDHMLGKSCSLPALLQRNIVSCHRPMSGKMCNRLKRVAVFRKRSGVRWLRDRGKRVIYFSLYTCTFCIFYHTLLLRFKIQIIKFIIFLLIDIHNNRWLNSKLFVSFFLPNSWSYVIGESVESLKILYANIHSNTIFSVLPIHTVNCYWYPLG